MSKNQKLIIIYEDNHLIAVNKKSGQLSQKDNTGDDSLIELLKEDIKIRFNKPGNVFVGAIHRLDRPVSGVIIFAKTSKGLERMNKLFKEKTIQKSYMALVNKMPAKEKDTLSNYLKKDPKRNKSFVVKKEQEGAKLASLKYQVVRRIGEKVLVKIDLLTGRHHQIRAQLSHIGCKIVGDLKYGYPSPNSDKSICLHCNSISFEHPVRKELVKIEADLPCIKEWKLENVTNRK